MDTVEKVYIGCPTYDGRLDAWTARSLFEQTSQKRLPIVGVGQFSLLNMNCNKLYCEALNLRTEHGIKWFAMLHADIIPEPNWLDILIDTAEANNADMLSAVVPMKDNTGDTSTALSNPSHDHWCLYKLKLAECAKLPPAFDVNDVIREFKIQSFTPKLLVNTGCMVVRIDKPWSEKLIFKTEDRIIQTPNGFTAMADSEDWNFSRQVTDNGGRVMATMNVKLEHVGLQHWPNY